MAQPKHSPNCICEHCGKAYHQTPKRLQQSRFCSQACRTLATTTVIACQYCGAERRVSRAMSPKYKYCNAECRALDNTIERRFWRKVRVAGVDDCWEWLGALLTDGYGTFTVDNRPKRATHVAWFIEHGEWPHEQMCHTCDNPRCVNPRHLYDADQSTNILDAYQKGRAQRGENHRSAVLTEADVLEIWRMIGDGLGDAEIAASFGVNHGTVYWIRSGRNWRHIHPNLQPPPSR